MFPDFTYANDEEKRRAVERDGLISCGDIGYLDGDGYLYLNDRRSDMVISGGVNIYPAEIEACLLALDGVRDCAVFGIPDEEFGEALAAHVELDEGAQLGEDEVRDHVRGRLAGYKTPRHGVLRAVAAARGLGQDLQAPVARAVLGGPGARDMSDLPEPRMIDVGDGIELSVIEAGEGPLVVLCHGFPELAFSWRRQIPALAAAGYRVLAPDMRGYGASSAPAAVEDYDVLSLCGDMTGLLDAVGRAERDLRRPRLGRQRDVVAGGDPPGARARRRGPERAVRPARPRGADPDHARAPRRGLLHRLVPAARRGRRGARTRRAPDADHLAAVDRAVGRGGGRADQTRRVALASRSSQVYIDAFERTGFTGGLNWYRNIDRNWELTAPFGERRIEQPAMFLTGELDPVRNFMPAEAMTGWVTDLRAQIVVPDAGHWVQQQAPEAVNDALLGFLAASERGRGDERRRGPPCSRGAAAHSAIHGSWTT